jgi:hypothetical protein
MRKRVLVQMIKMRIIITIRNNVHTVLNILTQFEDFDIISI